VCAKPVTNYLLANTLRKTEHLKVTIKSYKKHRLLFLILLGVTMLSITESYSQVWWRYNTTFFQDTIVKACSGSFVDDGGIIGSYDNDLNYEISFYIESGGTNILSMDFVHLDLASTDTLRVYDSDNSLLTNI
jgi:hypothetical protein